MRVFMGFSVGQPTAAMVARQAGQGLCNAVDGCRRKSENQNQYCVPNGIKISLQGPGGTGSVTSRSPLLPPQGRLR